MLMIAAFSDPDSRAALRVAVQVLVVLVVLGVILWGATQFPLDPIIAKLIRVVVIVLAVVLVVWFLLSLV